MDREAKTQQNLQGFGGQAVLELGARVGVAHRAKPDRAFDALAPQLFFEQLDGVYFYLHILEVFDTVAQAARIAVNALVLAAAVEVHIVAQAKDRVVAGGCEHGFGLDFVVHGWKGMRDEITSEE